MPTTAKPKARNAARRTMREPQFAWGNSIQITQEDIDAILARLDSMTKAERRQSLIDAEVLTKSGKLNKVFRGD